MNLNASKLKPESSQNLASNELIGCTRTGVLPIKAIPQKTSFWVNLSKTWVEILLLSKKTIKRKISLHKLKHHKIILKMTINYKKLNKLIILHFLF